MTTPKPALPVITVTTGQCIRLYDLLVKELQTSGLSRDAVQGVLDQYGPQVVTDVVNTVRRRAAMLSGAFVRQVRVHRVLTPSQLLKATGRRQTLSKDKSILRHMPCAGSDTVTVYFFQVKRDLRDSELAVEYVKRGLQPIDAYTLGQVNLDDPAFSDECPNGTHWVHQGRLWCYIAFGRSEGVRTVHVDVSGLWDSRWWYAGLRAE